MMMKDCLPPAPSQSTCFFSQVHACTRAACGKIKTAQSLRTARDCAALIHKPALAQTPLLSPLKGRQLRQATLQQAATTVAFLLWSSPAQPCKPTNRRWTPALR